MTEAKRRYNGMASLSIALETVIKPVIKKKGFLPHKIITDWHLIMGERLGKLTSPLKVTFRGKKQEEGTLYIEAYNGGIAMEIAYLEPVLLEKIASYFGYMAVTKIKIIQKPATSGMDELFPDSYQAPHLSPEANNKLEILMRDIEDPILHEALHGLGRHVIKKNESD